MKNSPRIYHFWNFTRLNFPKIIVDTWLQMKEAQLFMVASSLAYITILSIIPVLAVSFAIFQTFGGMSKLYETVEPMILSNLAHGTGHEVIDVLHHFISNTHATAFGVGGMIGLICTSMSMLSNVEKAINLAWKTSVKRGLFQRISAYWLFITLGPVAFSVAVGFATTFDLPLSHLLPSGTGMFIITVGLFFCIYKWVPYTPVQSICALIASIITAAFWNIARFCYILYIKNIVSYNKVYGSLGAVPILLVWIYIIWVVVLAGAALTSAIQKNSTPLFNVKNP